MHTISICNKKGGTGKTTLTANIAYELAYRGKKVLMLDLDAQSDLTAIYRPANFSGPDILDVLQKKCRISEAVVRINDNLFLVPGSKDIASFDFAGSVGALLPVVKHFAAKKMDFALIDHPPSLHEAALAGLAASDGALIVSEPEFLSVKNISQLVKDLNIIKKTLQPDLRILGVAFNKIDLRRNLTSDTLAKCRSILGKSMFDTTVSIDSAIPNSHNQNLPVRNLRWRSRTVTQFSDLASELVRRLGVGK